MEDNTSYDGGYLSDTNGQSDVYTSGTPGDNSTSSGGSNRSSGGGSGFDANTLTRNLLDTGLGIFKATQQKGTPKATVKAQANNTKLFLLLGGGVVAVLVLVLLIKK